MLPILYSSGGLLTFSSQIYALFWTDVYALFIKNSPLEHNLNHLMASLIFDTLCLTILGPFS